MQKFTTVVLLACFLVCLSGCHRSTEYENGQNGTSPQVQTTVPTQNNETEPITTDPTVTIPQIRPPTTADPVLDSAIINAYCELTDSDYLTDGQHMQVSHYLQIGDLYAVYVDGPWIYTQAIRNVTVFGFKFIFPDGQRMYLYRDGQICAVDDAEKENFATKDEIQSLWAYYKEKAGRLYGDAVTE